MNTLEVQHITLRRSNAFDWHRLRMIISVTISNYVFRMPFIDMMQHRSIVIITTYLSSLIFHLRFFAYFVFCINTAAYFVNRIRTLSSSTSVPLRHTFKNASLMKVSICGDDDAGYNRFGGVQYVWQCMVHCDRQMLSEVVFQ